MPTVGGRLSEIAEENFCRRSDFVNCLVECFDIALGRLAVSAQFPNVLKGSRTNVLVAVLRFGAESLDTSTHGGVTFWTWV